MQIKNFFYRPWVFFIFGSTDIVILRYSVCPGNPLGVTHTLLIWLYFYFVCLVVIIQYNFTLRGSLERTFRDKFYIEFEKLFNTIITFLELGASFDRIQQDFKQYLKKEPSKSDFSVPYIFSSINLFCSFLNFNIQLILDSFFFKKQIQQSLKRPKEKTQIKMWQTSCQSKNFPNYDPVSIQFRIHRTFSHEAQAFLFPYLFN